MLDKKILILGSGAIGSVIGGMLTKAGHDVTLLDQWSDHVDEMKRKGLIIEKYDGNRFSIPVKPIHIHELQMETNFDLIILSVKSYDTDWATQMSLGYLKNNGTIIVAQNGVNDPRVAEIASSEKVIGCVVIIGAALDTPGKVKWTGSPPNNVGLKVGELDGSISKRLDEIAELLSDVCPTETTNNLWGERWAKLATNCMANPLAGISSLGSGELGMNPKARKIMIEVAGEVVRVGRAQNINVEKIGSANPEVYANPYDGENLEEIESHMIERSENFTGGKPSLLQDVLKNRRTEVEFLNGLVSRLGKEHSVETPFNDKIISILKSVPPGEFVPNIKNLDYFDELLQD